MFRIAVLALFAGSLHGQAFEVASIKLGDPASPETSMHWGTGMLRIRGMTLKNLIVTAYDVKDFEVTGGPKWADGIRYDIVAKLDGGQPNEKDAKKNAARILAALRALLAERFHLDLREEVRSGPGYALVVAKSGLRIKPMETPQSMSTSSGRGLLAAKGASMDDIAEQLAAELRAPVLNKTAIAGVYEFRLKWAPDTASDDPSAERPGGPSLFTAIQETLGLKLESQKLPVKLLVIDRAEKPDEN